MKISKWTAIIALLAIMPLLQSCLKSDSDNWYNEMLPEGSILAIGTVHLTIASSPGDFYFLLDNNETVYPTMRTASIFKKYEAKEGQRVFIGFRELDSIEGYDYSGEILALQDILTKDIIPLTEATADSIGNDRINATSIWLTGKSYLNIECQFYASGDNQHMLNLVMDEANKGQEIDEEGYICVEFRHNAFDDNLGGRSNGIASFKLDTIADLIEKGAKGLKIRVNTIYDGVKEYKKDFKEEEQTKTIFTPHSQISALTTDIIY